MSEFQVRDQRKPGHHWADNEVIDDFGHMIGMQGYAIYMYLCRHAGNRNGKCIKTQVEIGKAFGASIDTVQRHVERLIVAGLVSVERQHDNSLVYFILEVPKQTANCGNPSPQNAATLPQDAVTSPQNAVSNKEVRLITKLNLNKPPTPLVKNPEPSANDLEPQDAGRALGLLMGVSGYTAMAAMDAIGSVKRRKPDMRYTDIPEFVVNLWREVSTQPKRALPSVKTFLNEIGQYIESDHWKAVKKNEFIPVLDWQGGHIGEDGVYVNRHGKRMPGFICPAKPREAGD